MHRTWRGIAAAKALGLGLGLAAAAAEAITSNAWRIVNGVPVEVVWRLKTLAFFSDEECMKMHLAVTNETGVPIATEAGELTGADHVFNLRSHRGWESVEHCDAGGCYLGFEWSSESFDVQCIMLSQGEEGLHASSIVLQRRRDDQWEEVARWEDVAAGKSKLALRCPAVPGVQSARVVNCHRKDHLHEECTAVCSEGLGAVEPRVRCINGAWFLPQCLPVGSMVRLVAREPDSIKPYWVVMNVQLFTDPSCNDHMIIAHEDGDAISSGEFVIKYASYHPRNIWDGSKGTSWASSTPCTPSTCWVGFRFHEAPSKRVRCVRVLHPVGEQYHATKVAFEFLGPDGWEEDADVPVNLLVVGHDEL